MRAGSLLAALGFVAVVAAAVAGDGSPSPLTGSRSPAASTPRQSAPTDRGALPTQTARATGAVAAARVVEMTFDERAIGTESATDLLAERPSGSVEIAAFPTAVDRSLRLRVPGGEVASACMEVLPALDSLRGLRAELHVAAPLSAGRLALEARSASTAVGAVVVNDVAALPAGTWLIVEFVDGRPDDAARVMLAANDELVAEAAVTEGGPGAVDRVCLELAGTREAVDVYIRSLVVRG